MKESKQAFPKSDPVEYVVSEIFKSQMSVLSQLFNVQKVFASDVKVIGITDPSETSIV